VGARETLDREQFPKAVGRRIAELRCWREMTQQQLADKMGIDVSAVQRHERGTHSPTLDTLWRIGKALRVLPIELLYTSNAESEARKGRPSKSAAAARETPEFAVMPRTTPK
jgi:transcriptional regulator with XRE-family HTH domain